MNIFLPSFKEDQNQAENRLELFVNTLNKMSKDTDNVDKIQNKIKQIKGEIQYLRKHHSTSPFVNLRATTFGFLIVEDFPELKEFL